MKRKKIQSLLRLRAIAAAQREDGGPDAELVVYGDIGESWWGDSVSARSVVQQLADMQAEHILVRVNSYGGSVSDGVAIHNALRAHGARITTRNEGVAASIASLILMAGDDVEMYPNTTLMIHAPWTIAMGNSSDMRQTADVLDVHAKAMASSYARQSGASVDEELAQLLDGVDHWFTADQALESGYVTAVLDVAPAQSDTEARAMPRSAPVFAAFTRYRGAPIQVAASFGEPPRHALLPIEVTTPSQPAARAAQHQEFFMNWKAIAQSLGLSLPDSCTETEAKAKVCEKLALAASATDMEVAIALAKRASAEGRNNPATAPPQADPAAQAAFQAAETGRRAAIRTAFLGFRDRPAVAALETECLDNLNCTVEVAREKLLAKLGEGSEPLNGGAGHVSAGLDATDKRQGAAVQALLVRAGVQQDPVTKKPLAFDGANPFRGRTMSEVARMSLSAAGVSSDHMDSIDMVRGAMGVTRVRGAQTTSDFPVILENVLHKMVLTGYYAYSATFQRFVRIGDVTDFREWKRLTPGIIANLQSVNEAGEYKNKNLPDAEKLGITVTRHGNIIEITPEVVINDDLGTVMETARQLGMAGPRTIEREVYRQLALNGGAGPTMADGNPLFHASRNNIDTAPAVASVTSLAKGADAMAQQTAPGEDAEYLDIQPRTSVTNHAVSRDIQVLVQSEYDPDAANKLQRPNKVRGLVSDIVGSPRVASPKVYLFADPAIAPVFEVAYLNGQREVRVVQEENFRTAGLAWRGELPFGVAPIGYRGGWYNPGA